VAAAGIVALGKNRDAEAERHAGIGDAIGQGAGGNDLPVDPATCRVDERGFPAKFTRARGRAAGLGLLRSGSFGNTVCRVPLLNDVQKNRRDTAVHLMRVV